MHRRATTLAIFVAFCSVLLQPFQASAQVNANSFSPITWYLGGANNTYAFATGDLNGDGFAEVVVSNQRYNDPVDVHTGVGIYINNGDGSFHAGPRYPTDGYGSSWQSVAIADMDGDGKQDLVVLNSAAYCAPVCQPTQSVSVLRGNGDGTFLAAVSYLLNIYQNTAVSPDKLTVADVNRDGRPDILVSDSVNRPSLPFPNNIRGGVSVLLNQGSGAFATAVLYDSGGYDGAPDILAADVNRDGFPDIVLLNVCSVAGAPTDPCRAPSGTYAQGTVGVLLGNGDGTFQTATNYSSGGITPGSIAAADLNRDGKVDLLVTNGACFQCGGTMVSVLIGNGDGSFQSPVNYNDGATQPVSVAAGDIDGDGFTDVAVMNYCTAGQGCNGSTGALSVMLGNGDGTLQSPVVYFLWSTSVGSNPGAVLVSELSNDGKPDLVIGAWNGLGVLLNQTPRAATTTTLLLQPNPSSYGQGVTLTATVSSASPGTPTGTVTFTEGQTILGSAPLAGGVATTNISTLGVGAHSITASYSSDNSFRASVSTPFPQFVKAVTTTAVVSSVNPSEYQQFVTFTATVTSQLGTVSGSVTFKDGNSLLVSAPISGNSAGFTTPLLAAGAHSITAVYSGDSSNVGSTSPVLNQTVNSSAFGSPAGSGAGGSSAPLSIAVGDVNKDGFPDLVTASLCYQYPNPIDCHAGAGVLLNNGNGTFQSPLRFATDGAHGSSVATADVDGDGNLDLIVANLESSGPQIGLPPVSVLRGNGDGTFQAAVSYVPAPNNPNDLVPNRAIAADVNGDGKPDLVVAMAGNAQHDGAVSVLLNAGNGTFAAPVLFDSGGSNPTDLITADVNGDGVPDVIAVNYCGSVVCNNGGYAVSPGNLGLLLGNGNGTFQPAVVLSTGGYAPRALAAVDLNGDGNPDLVVTQCPGGPGGCTVAASAAVLLGDGRGHFSAAMNYSAGVSQSIQFALSWIDAGDLDGDGYMDVVVVNPCDRFNNCTGLSGTVSLLKGNGDGTLQAPTLYNVGGYPSSVVVADVNADGKPDIGFTSNNGTFVLLNQSLRATTTTTLVSQPNPSGYGASVNFTATVSSASPGTPSGTVTFSDGVTTLGTAALIGGVAAMNVSNLALGVHNVVASYSSDSFFRASVSAPVTQVVKTTTTTAVVSSVNPSGDQQQVTFTATVTSLFGGAVSGSVTFKDGNNVLGSEPLLGSNADFSTTSLAVGVHLISAVYNGDSSNLGSISSVLNQTVSPTTQVTVGTAPSGLTIVVDGTTYTSPQTFAWVVGSAHTIETSSPQTSGQRYVFMNWSDGGAMAHSVVAPPSATIYTANFVAAAAPVPSRVAAWGFNSFGQLGFADDSNFKPDEVVNLGPGSNVTQVAGGNNHSLALTSDGTVWAWGLNNVGQVGDGSPANNRLVPVQVSGLGSGSGIVAIAAGGAFSMALKSDGTVLTWGQNLNGQLGDGTTTSRSIPGAVSGLGSGSGVIAIAAGAASAYALKSDGTVLSWGNNANGQLGDGSTTQRVTPVPVTGLGSGSGVIAVASSAVASHALALKSDGSVVSWGMNVTGQLGTGNTIQQTSPAAVGSLGSGSGVIAIAIGGAHSMALKSDGSVVAWGSNGAGQIGDNFGANVRLTPVAVTGIGTGSGVVAITAGSAFSMALKSDGTALAWGNNANAQLSSSGNPCCEPIPVLVHKLTGATVLAAGGAHSLAVTSSGGVLSWGTNVGGQLGKNSIDANAFPLGTFNNDDPNLDGQPLSDIIAVSGGGNHSLALKSDGTVRAWGGNNGQLGDGFADGTWDGTALQVRNPANTGPLTGVAAISAGSGNYSVALQSDGTVLAWGTNGNGQLGDGTNFQRFLPVQVSGFGPGSGVVAISAGANHTLALKLDGSVWAWGGNANGRLGDGTTIQRFTPVQVSGLGIGSGVVAIAAGNGYSLAMKADGSVWAWGNNANGQLGDGTLVQKLTPTQVLDPSGTGFLGGAIAIAANGSSMVLKSDGTVWTWGANAAGQLGDGTFTDRSLPVQVVGAGGSGFLSGAVAIGAGTQNGQALKADGTVWTWGFDQNGNLGNGTFGAGSATPVQALIAAVNSIAAGTFHSLALVPMPAGLVDIDFSASSDGLRLQFDGVNVVTDFVSQNVVATIPLLPGTSFSMSTTSPQAGPPGTRYVFDNWSDGGAISHVIAVPNSSTALSLNFKTQYQLTTSASPVAGGSIAASPSSVDGYYDSGTSIQLTGLPATGYLFSGWNGDLSGTANPQSISMTAVRNVTANFTSTASIMFNTMPAGLDIIVDGTPYTAPRPSSGLSGAITRLRRQRRKPGPPAPVIYSPTGLTAERSLIASRRLRARRPIRRVSIRSIC